MVATVTFSLEVELGWGLVQYGNLSALSEERRAETVFLQKLLDLCDELQIPITFNVVGHLLRDRPLSTYESPHEDGWFEGIPKTGPEADPKFYAPDLVGEIVSASVDHEICTHTFTHVELESVSRETLRWEFDRVLEEHDTFGLDRPTSIVPPRHSPPPRDILREYEIETIRSPRYRAQSSTEASNRFELGKDILTGAQPIVPPRNVDGVVETYTTKFPSLTAPFLKPGRKSPHPVFRALPKSARKKLHIRNMNSALSTAIQHDSFVHMWSHLWETANNVQFPQIEKFLRRVARARTSDLVQIKTMEALNNMVRSPSTA